MAITDAEIAHPNVRKFLDFISKAEGTEKFGYHTQVGGTQIAELTQHPKKTTVTTADGSSNAAGRYQFIGSTWDIQAKKLGLTDFGALNQDKAAVGLIKDSGAFDQVVSGDYAGAINKLGGQWASLPSSRYKQPKKSWEWANAELGINGSPPKETTRDFNDSGFQQGGMTPSAIVRKQLQDEQKPNTPFSDFAGGFVTGLKNDNTGTNWYQTKMVESVEDPNFKWTEELSKKYTEGLKDKNWQFVWENATSEAHAAQLRTRALEFQANEDKYKEMGMGAGAGRLVAGLFDPTNLGIIALTAVAPQLGAPVAATRWGRIGYGVAEGAAINMGIEAATFKNRPGGDVTDVAFAGLMGVAFGGVGGELGHRLATSAARRMDVPGSGGATIFDNDLKNIQSWGLDQLHDMSAADYARVRMFSETELNPNLTPEQLNFRTAELIHEYNMLVEKRKLETLYGTGSERPPGLGEPPVKDAPETFRKTWSQEWDTPAYHTDSKGSTVLQLPPKQPIESLVEYIRMYSTDSAMVSWMNKIIEGIDFKYVKYYETGNGKKPSWYVRGSTLGTNHLAHIQTPWNSLGTMAGSEVKFVMRGKYRKDLPSGKTKAETAELGDRAALKTGLTDSTFVHELTHVGAVYKQRLFDRTKTGQLSKHQGNIEGNEATYEAVKGMDELYRYVKSQFTKAEAKQHYGLTNAYEFLAEGLSNPYFQKMLKGLMLPNHIKANQHVLSKFLDDVMKMLGIEKGQQTAFHKFLELAEPLVEPGGIKRKSTVSTAPKEGYRPSPDGRADLDTAQAAEMADIPEVFGFGLGLENRLNKSRLPDAVRGLAQKLFGTTVGYKDHSVVKANAWDDKTLLAGGWNTQLRKGTLMPFLEWSQTAGYKFHERGAAFEKFGTDVWEYVHGFDGDYAPQVIKAGDAVRKNMAERVKDINNPSRTVGGVQRGLTETEVTLLDGTKKMTGTLEENPFYLPRVHDANKWDFMVNTHGLAKVESFWASAYKSGRDPLEVSDADANLFAKWYRKTVEQSKNQASSQHLTDMLRGQDRPALLESLQDMLSLDAETANRFADQILGQRRNDSGQIVANLKHRSTIDEKFVGTRGSDIEGMSLKDFVRTNALEITESYNNRVAGTVSLAKNMDVYKASDINKLIGDSVKREFGDGFKEVDLANAAKDLQFAFDRILGIPIEEGFSPIRKGLAMLRDFNVIRLMSGAVYNQLAETAQMTGTVGYRALLKAIPEMDAFARDAKTGRAPSDLLDHLENSFGGAGGEYINRMDFSERTSWRDHYGEGSWQSKLDSADAGLNRFASGVLDYTGMTPLMVQQKRIHATALVNGFVDLANGVDRGGAAFLTKDRLAYMGLSEQDFASLKGVLKSLSSDGEGAIKDTAKAIDWDRFVAESPELHHKFMTAIMRESRRVIQENDLASMLPFMGTTLGKTAFQFMNFGMQAWNKQLMFSINHADMATANVMLQGLLYGSLVYTGRMQQQSLGMTDEDRQKFLEDRLRIDKIVANGFSRMGASSMLPNLASTLIPGASSLFAGGRTTSDLSGLMSNPTLGLANSLVTLGKKSVINPISEEKQFTKSDMNAFFKLMPLNNLMGVNTLLNHISSDFPISSSEGAQ